MDILHPHMLSKQQLLEIFHQRHFTIPRLEELSRDELISLYVKHLLPLPRRQSSRPAASTSSTCNDVEMTDASPNKPNSSAISENRKSSNVRPRIVYSENPMDNVSQGVKRIRLINSGGASGGNHSQTTDSAASALKRSHEVTNSGRVQKHGASPIVEASVTPCKRKKITWP